MNAAVPCPVRLQAETRPDGPAVVTPSGTWTWADLDRDVGRWAAYFESLGPTGTRLGVRAETTPRMVGVVLAALRSGHVLVPVAARLPEVSLAAYLDRLGDVVRVPDGADPPEVGEVSPPPIPLDRPATIVATSGSTGTPKAALHTAGHHVWSARGWRERLPLGPGDRWLLDLPLHHVGGLAVVYRCAFAGAAVAIPAPKTPTAAALRALDVTHASLVATQLHRMLEAGTERPPSVRTLLLGGSGIPATLLDRAHAQGWPLLVSYGLTEMASTVTSTRLHAARAELGTAGTPLPYREVRVRDGEIEVRGRTRFAGYVERDRLHTPFDADGWFTTGDLGHVDAQGRLCVMGRRDNRFISGGENIQPEAIEAVLLRQPGVVRAVVVPVADAEFGERPVAFVETGAGRPVDPVGLTRAVEEALPRFMRPDAVYPWPEGDEGLKPSRAAFRAEAERRRAARFS